jgi:hypothetical protein
MDKKLDRETALKISLELLLRTLLGELMSGRLRVADGGSGLGSGVALSPARLST